MQKMTFIVTTMGAVLMALLVARDLLLGGGENFALHVGGLVFLIVLAYFDYKKLKDEKRCDT